MGGQITDYRNLSQAAPCWVFKDGKATGNAWIYTGGFVLPGGGVTGDASVGGSSSSGSRPYTVGGVSGAVIAGAVSGKTQIYCSGGTADHPTVAENATVSGGKLMGVVYVGNAEHDECTVSGNDTVLNGASGGIHIGKDEKGLATVSGGYIEGKASLYGATDMSGGQIISSSGNINFDLCTIVGGIIQYVGSTELTCYGLEMYEGGELINLGKDAQIGADPRLQDGNDGATSNVSIWGMVSDNIRLSNGVVVKEKASVRGNVALHGPITVKKEVRLYGTWTVFSEEAIEIDEDVASLLMMAVECSGSSVSGAESGVSMTYEEALAAFNRIKEGVTVDGGTDIAGKPSVDGFVCAPGWTLGGQEALDAAFPDYSFAIYVPSVYEPEEVT
jgi:hypothetical protein